jgi:hypothetical protein
MARNRQWADVVIISKRKWMKSVPADGPSAAEDRGSFDGGGFVMWYRAVLVALFLIVVHGAHGATATLRLDDPTDRVVVEHDAALNPASAITIELWIRPTALGCDTLVGKDFVDGYWFGYCGGGLRYYYGGGNQVTSVLGLPLSEWSHVAVSYDRSTVRFYVNGETAGSFFRPGAMPSDNALLGIGGEGSSSSFPSGLFPFEGWMSEVRIWSTARSLTQIRENMYRQIVAEEPGLVGVWGLEGGPDDRFNAFTSSLSEFASFSSLDSPAVPTEPLIIRSTTSSGVDGICTPSNYTTSTRVPVWYPQSDLPLGENNPQEILIGATGVYIFVCLPRRTRLDDPIWFVELDTDNDGGALDSADWRFRLWPSQGTPLTSARGAIGGPPFFPPFWEATANPTGLWAREQPGAEFVGDMEWRLPRSIFAEPFEPFRMRVTHDYLVGASNNVVTWPDGSSSTSPDGWQEVRVDLTPQGPPDARNPTVRTEIAEDRPSFADGVEIEILAFDDVDIELVELLIDDVVVDFQEFTGGADRSTTFTHTGNYPVGTHSYQARAFDHAGREVLSLFRSFRVVVDGAPPEVTLRTSPLNPNPGQSVVMVATATDPSGVDTIWVRDVLGFNSPSFRRCDFSGANTTETCTWSITPSSSLLRLRVDAQARDAEGFFADTADYVVLFGNSGPDQDDDGLADSIESRLCTDPRDPDTDKDGLGDGWETLGIRFADGELEPLIDYGVNPCWRNVLFQMDWEEGSQPPAETFDNLRNRYRENGITVYLERNERPRATAYPQSHVGAIEAAYQLEDGEFYLNPRRLWAFYYGYQRALQGRSGASPPFFTMDHFTGTSAINGGVGGFCRGGTDPGKDCRGDFECPGAGATCQSGCIGGTRDQLNCSSREDCPDGEGGFRICAIPCTTAPGALGPACRPIPDIPTRLMHELGHAVGLGHGGNTGTRVASADRGFVTLDFEWDSENFKPNHQSIMNYGQWGGALCVEPFPDPLPEGFRPTIVGQINYTNLDQGDLNEAALSESFNSTFAKRLRERSCALASATSVPVVEYNCRIGDDDFVAWSDGRQTLARKPADGSWDYDPPAHALGIDWNCDGVINGAAVSVDISGFGIDNSLLTLDEFDAIPNPTSCQDIWSPNCEDRAASCYRFPPAYRAELGTLATGLDPVDCRDTWLGRRMFSDNMACRGGDDSDFGTGTCPQISIDAQVPNAYVAIPEVWAHGEPIDPQFETATPDTPNIENCDLADNDGDGLVDEGCADRDNDLIPDAIDNCPTISNGDQADRDDDGLGEACQFPGISNLTAIDGASGVQLSWTGDGVPRSGYVLYRLRDLDRSDTFLGRDYPSTITTSYLDAPAFGGSWTYIVRALNLNGQEGDPVTVQVNVNPDLMFRDSFEGD